MQLTEIMQTDLVTCPPDATVAQAAAVMRERRVGACLVMEGTAMAGIITERDLVGLVADGSDLTVMPVTAAMSGAITTAPPDADVLWAADTMKRTGIRHLPVVEQGYLMGMVSLRDLFAAAEAVLRLDPEGADTALEMLSATRR